LDGRHERPGLPEVPNGRALCKIHHSAYDVNILGVSPDYRVHIRSDVLREHDGPMLKWGLQEMDRGKPLGAGEGGAAAQSGVPGGAV
jgi:putative restriction endonuclease